jgi:DNA-binding GntR family transcriptional regulator
MTALELDASQALVQNAGDAAADQIRMAILDGRLKPGERLKEAAVAQAFRISRTPVREALRVLQIEGLVVATPNRGAAVCRYTAAELRDVYELRALLEGHAARRAAGCVTPEELRALDDSCTRFRALREREAPIIELVDENSRFHAIVLKAAGSTKLTGTTRAVTDLPLVYRTYNWYSSEQRLRAERQHERLVGALEAGDGDRAEQVMTEHILEGCSVLFEHLDVDGEHAGWAA